jgi:nucleotide-binding universal stress UspA family protein
MAPPTQTWLWRSDHGSLGPNVLSHQGGTSRASRAEGWLSDSTARVRLAPPHLSGKEWIAAALEPAEQGARELRAGGFRAEARAVLGAPARRLLADADKTQADIVVVGSRGSEPSTGWPSVR